IRSNERGGIDLGELRGALGPHTAALMITNPSTLGIFEDQIDQVVAAVHEAGAIAYMDGANLNAILGRFRAGDAGFDVMHFNLHTYTYIRRNGDAGLREVSDDAVLAANYLRVRLTDAYDLPYDRICKHEVVFSGRRQKREHGVTTLDIAKAILDYGIHPPTIY